MGKYSSNLFTLNTFYSSIKRTIKGNTPSDSTLSFLCKYWNCVASNIIQWNELNKKEISKVDLRENYIVTQGVVIQAIGQVGSYFINNSEINMYEILKGLKNIDWRRSASIWKNRVIRADGKILTSNKAILLASNQIKKELGIPLLPDEELKEKRYLESLTI